MLEDKLRSTDWEATYEAIEEAVARESYLTWLREQEKQTGTSRQGLQVRGRGKRGGEGRGGEGRGGEGRGGEGKVAEVFNSISALMFHVMSC